MPAVLVMGPTVIQLYIYTELSVSSLGVAMIILSTRA